MEQRQRRTRSGDSRTSASPQFTSGDGSCVGLAAVGVDHSGRRAKPNAPDATGTRFGPSVRGPTLNAVGGHVRALSPANNDVDAVSCYLADESTSRADGGSDAAWLTRHHQSVQADRRTASRSSQLYSPTGNGASVHNNFCATPVDPPPLWRLAHPLTGKTLV